MTDIRWSQRFNHFKNAYAQLQEALGLMETRPLSNLEKQGTIQAFEFTYELAWNVLRDYLVWQGAETISGSRDAIREGFKRELISDGHTRLAMLEDRQQTINSYQSSVLNQILGRLQQAYSPLFYELSCRFSDKQLELEPSR